MFFDASSREVAQHREEPENMNQIENQHIPVLELSNLDEATLPNLRCAWPNGGPDASLN
jgi:hypothetical protein